MHIGTNDAQKPIIEECRVLSEIIVRANTMRSMTLFLNRCLSLFNWRGIGARGQRSTQWLGGCNPTGVHIGTNDAQKPIIEECRVLSEIIVRAYMMHSMTLFLNRCLRLFYRRSANSPRNNATVFAGSNSLLQYVVRR